MPLYDFSKLYVFTARRYAERGIALL